MDEFKEGQFVQIINHRFAGASGFITNIEVYRKQALVQLIKDVNGEPIKNKTSFIFTNDQIVPAELENTNDDIKRLIDFALDIRDFEWVKELSSQLK